MGARKKQAKTVAAQLKSAGANDLARRLIEAFDLDDEFNVTAASWLDAELDVQVASVHRLIPDDAYGDDDVARNG